MCGREKKYNKIARFTFICVYRIGQSMNRYEGWAMSYASIGSANAQERSDSRRLKRSTDIISYVLTNGCMTYSKCDETIRLLIVLCSKYRKWRIGEEWLTSCWPYIFASLRRRQKKTFAPTIFVVFLRVSRMLRCARALNETSVMLRANVWKCVAPTRIPWVVSTHTKYVWWKSAANYSFNKYLFGSGDGYL